MTESQLDPTVEGLLQQIEEVRYALHHLHVAVSAGNAKDRVWHFNRAQGYAGRALSETVVVGLPPRETDSEPVDIEILAVDATMLEIANTPGHPLAVALPDPLPFLLADAEERHGLLRKLRNNRFEPHRRPELSASHDRRMCAAWDVSLVLGTLVTAGDIADRTSADDEIVSAHLRRVNGHLLKVVRDTPWTEAQGVLAGCGEIRRLWPQRDTKASELAELVATTAAPIQALVAAELETWHRQLSLARRSRLRSAIPPPGAVAKPGQTSVPPPRAGRPGLGGGW